MAIQYFPGHMHKARGQIRERLARTDVVLDVRDARAPLATGNPLLAELIGDLPCIRILNKQDLANAAITSQWVQHFKTHPNRTAIALSAADTRQHAHHTKTILALCKQLAPKRVARQMQVRVLIVGIPNIGKSTVINMLANKRITRVGDEPGITRTMQQIKIGTDVILFDTPGVLWPKLEDQEIALRLAALGTIRETVLDMHAIAIFVIAQMLAHAPSKLTLAARYKITDIQGLATPHACLEAIARARGCVKPGGVLDEDKAAEMLLRDFRSGTLGGMSLERPAG